MDIELPQTDANVSLFLKYKRLLFVIIVGVILTTVSFFIYNTFTDYPEVKIQQNNYKVTANVKSDIEIVPIQVYRDGKFIITLDTTGDHLVEYVPPQKYNYEFRLFTKNIIGMKNKSSVYFDIEVLPIKPTISYIKSTPLKKGYSSDVIAKVENASKCKSDLLLYSADGFDDLGPNLLMSREFSIGKELDYFYSHEEKWSWEGILFPTPVDTNTSNYDVRIRLNCSDYYNSISEEKTVQMVTSDDISSGAISISYMIDQNKKVTGEIMSTIWADLKCRLLIGDQSNVTLDEKNITIEGRHIYQFDISKYNRNLMYITALCTDPEGRPINKISTYKAD